MSTDFIMKILTLGDTAVGKTSIIHRYMETPLPKKSLTTIGVDFRNKIIKIDQNTKVKLVLWDTAGQERFRNVATNYYNGTDCALLVFDITNEGSFKIFDYWVKEIQQKKKMDDICLILVGNKSDLQENRKVSQQEIDKYIEKLKIRYFEVSAIKDEGITELFDYAVKETMTIIRKRDVDPRISKLSVENVSIRPKGNKCC